jgi:hypothetical protein
MTPIWIRFETKKPRGEASAITSTVDMGPSSSPTQIATTSNNRRVMSFHAKALIGFLAFHLVFTGLPLLADQLAWTRGAYSEEPYLADIAAVIWTAVTLSVSVAGLAVAYLVWGVMRYLGRGVGPSDHQSLT